MGRTESPSGRVAGRAWKGLLLISIVGLMVFAFAGTAFANYGQSMTIPALTAGNAFAIDPTFTKASSDPGPSSVHYFEVVVTGPNAQTSVVGVNDGNWYPPLPAASGPGFIQFVSNQYIAWTGNTGKLIPPPPSIRFNSPGTYHLEVRLCADSGVYPSPTWIQSTTYTVVVAAPGTVSTPASSPWSLALAAAVALGLAGASINKSRRTADVDA